MTLTIGPYQTQIECPSYYREFCGCAYYQRVESLSLITFSCLYTKTQLHIKCVLLKDMPIT